jgi:hypothetical protein
VVLLVVVVVVADVVVVEVVLVAYLSAAGLAWVTCTVYQSPEVVSALLMT